MQESETELKLNFIWFLFYASQFCGLSLLYIQLEVQGFENDGHGLTCDTSFRDQMNVQGQS